MDAGDRRHAGEPASGADDDLSVDLLAQDSVRRADIVLALGGDRGRLEPEAGLAHRPGGLGDDLVGRGAPALEREVEALELYLHAEERRIEQPERLLEELLSGLVALEDDDLDRVGHAARTIADDADPSRARSNGWTDTARPRHGCLDPDVRMRTDADSDRPSPDTFSGRLALPPASETPNPSRHDVGGAAAGASGPARPTASARTCQRARPTRDRQPSWKSDRPTLRTRSALQSGSETSRWAPSSPSPGNWIC